MNMKLASALVANFAGHVMIMRVASWKASLHTDIGSIDGYGGNDERG